MKNKFFASLLCIVMLVNILPVYAFAEDNLSDWTYNAFRDGTAEITGYTGTETELVFPEEIDGYTMVGIADNAFTYELGDDCPITSITIPDTYKRIGDNVFFWSMNLAEINLPHTLEFIGLNVFDKTALYLNTRHELRVNRQPEVFYIGEYLIKAEQRSSYIPDRYTIREGTKLIASGAFFCCHGLKNVIIPEGVEHINDGAFLWCNNLKSLVLPRSTKRIERLVFELCDSLNALVIPETVEYIDDQAFSPGRIQFINIYGTSGSLAEEFAKKNGATFIDIKDALYGDVNQDGTINSNDYASMKSNVMCQAELDGNAEIIADINNDGVIDAFDISEVSRIINGF